MTCKCYHAERNFVGEIGVCWGTKECEACSCGGDESKCDFFEDKRKKATPKTTNADRIRQMSDEELAWWISGAQCIQRNPAEWEMWLKSPVEENE